MQVVVTIHSIEMEVENAGGGDSVRVHNRLEKVVHLNDVCWKHTGTVYS